MDDEQECNVNVKGKKDEHRDTVDSAFGRSVPRDQSGIVQETGRDGGQSETDETAVRRHRRCDSSRCAGLVKALDYRGPVVVLSGL